MMIITTTLTNRLDDQVRVEHVLARHRPRLLATPGCTAVAIGSKQVRGIVRADQPAIVVFVERKGSPSRDHAIPATLDGVAVDVVERRFNFRTIATDPHTRYHKLQAGLAITTWEDAGVNGTLGCFIRTTGKTATAGHPAIPAGVYLLSNHHVLQSADPATGADPRVIQPEYTAGQIPTAPYVCGRYVDGYRSPTADCAIASIAITRSWTNSMPRAPGWPGAKWLKKTSAPQHNQDVCKFGATTRYTTGRITNTNFSTPNNDVQNALYVQNMTQQTFAAGGDSGSVIVTPWTDEVVGLMFKEDTQTPVAGTNTCYAALAYPIHSQMNLFCDAGGAVTLPWV